MIEAVGKKFLFRDDPRLLFPDQMARDMEMTVGRDVAPSTQPADIASTSISCTDDH
jgi:hypothetical protein